MLSNNTSITISSYVKEKNSTQTDFLLVQTAMPNSGGRWMPGPYPNMAGNYPSGVNMGPGNIPKNYPMMYPPGNMMPQVGLCFF